MPPANTFTRAFNLKQLEPLRRTQREYGSSSSGMSFPGAHSGLFFREHPLGLFLDTDHLGIFFLHQLNRTFPLVDEQTLQLNYLSTISTFTHLRKPVVAFSFLLGSPQIETLLLLLHTYSNSRPLTRIEELLEPNTRRDALRAFSPHTARNRANQAHLSLTSSFPAEKMHPHEPTDRPTDQRRR